MKPERGPCAVRVLYSSQSGRAKACARRSCRVVSDVLAKHNKTQAMLLANKPGITFDQDLAQYNQNIFDWAESLKRPDNTVDGSSLLILFVSTTGDGEHTDTIQTFWKQLLKKSIPRNLLEGVQFSIFGLGDRAYGPQFCAASRKLAIRFCQLGATFLPVNQEIAGEPGYGDDGTPGGGVLADLDTWLQSQLIPSLLFRVGVDKPGLAEVSTAVVAPTLDPSSFRPYTVDVSAEKFTSKIAGDRDNQPEWNTPEFVDAYKEFLESRRPVTAYHYSLSKPSAEDEQGQSLQRETLPSSQDPNVSTNQNTLLLAKLVENRRLTDKDWEQDTRHLRLEIDRIPSLTNVNGSSQRPTAATRQLQNLPYQAGDVVSIMPSNSEKEVAHFLSVLPLSVQAVADHQLTISVNPDGKTSGMGDSFVCNPDWPSQCTLRGWLTYCADIHALPEREDLWALSLCCSLTHESGQAQREKLQQLSDGSGSALYTDYVLRQKRGWADVLYDFDSLRAPGSQLSSLAVLLGLLSPIRPREFSIASSPTKEMANSTQTCWFGMDLCVAVVEGETPLKRTYHGLASDYICRQVATSAANDSVPPIRCWVRPGSFHQLPLAHSSDLPHRFDQPVLYIGAGTGVAPLRGLIQERQQHNLHAQEHARDGASAWVCDDLLVFGCRKKGADYYYAKEWEKLEEEKKLGLLTAFSQDQWHKIYVQQVLKASDTEGQRLYAHLANRQGCLYIAGGAKMARSVKDEIVELLSKQMGNNEAKAKQLLAKLQRLGRFRVEAWS